MTPEPILPITMVALDIDGTLVGDDLVIGPDTRQAIRNARERGIIVTLITGRMVSSALRFARELDLVAPIVGYQGALIREMPAPGSKRPGRLLIHTPLSAGVAREVIVWARQHGLDPHVNHLERFVIRSDDPRADEYSTFMGHQPDREDDLVASIKHPVTKVMCHGEPPLPTEVAPLARARFAGLADVTVSHPHFIEFVAPGVSKGRAVRWLARRLGVELGAVLAIGDQWNDIEMLAEVGHGTAMPTAPAEVQAVARYVAPPLAEEGVARMIEALVLARPADVRVAAARMAEAASAATAVGGRHRHCDRHRHGAGPRVSARIVADDAAGRDAAIEVLRAGGVVALPTDTVYGVAVALGTPGGVERLFAVKRRPPEKGIMLLLDDAAQAGSIGEMGPAAAALADACWPGGLTVVVPRRPEVTLPAALTGGAPTIGLRVPDHDAPRALARGVGPLPTTSANVSGLPEARDAAEIFEQLGDVIDLILDGGVAHGGPASTVMDCTGALPQALRVGAIPLERVAAILDAAGVPHGMAGD